MATTEEITAGRSLHDYVITNENCFNFDASKSKSDRNKCVCQSYDKWTFFIVNDKFRCSSRQEIAPECKSRLGNSVPLLKKQGKAWIAKGQLISTGKTYCQTDVLIWKSTQLKWQMVKAQVKIAPTPKPLGPPHRYRTFAVSITPKSDQLLAGALLKVLTSCDVRYKDCLLLKAEGEFKYKVKTLPTNDPPSATTNEHSKQSTNEENDVYILIAVLSGIIVALIVLFLVIVKCRLKKIKQDNVQVNFNSDKQSITITNQNKSNDKANPTHDIQHQHGLSARPYDYPYEKDFGRRKEKYDLKAMTDSGDNNYEGLVIKNCSADSYTELQRENTYTGLTNDFQPDEYCNLEKASSKGNYTGFSKDIVPSYRPPGSTESTYSELLTENTRSEYTTLETSNRFRPKSTNTAREDLMALPKQKHVSQLINKIERISNAPLSINDEPDYMETEPEYFETEPE